VGDSTIKLFPGAVVFIPKNCRHRLSNAEGAEPLIVVDVQLGERFDEDDIERLGDLYGRV
jgi:mannose-1-phosphate guanylyltransferase/mannose-6-phosphate isomerase